MLSLYKLADWMVGYLTQQDTSGLPGCLYDDVVPSGLNGCGQLGSTWF